MSNIYDLTARWGPNYLSYILTSNLPSIPAVLWRISCLLLRKGFNRASPRILWRRLSMRFLCPVKLSSMHWRSILLVVMLGVTLTSTSSVSMAGARTYGVLEPVVLMAPFWTFLASIVGWFCHGIGILMERAQGTLQAQWIVDAGYASIGTEQWYVLQDSNPYMKSRRRSGIIVLYPGLAHRESPSLMSRRNGASGLSFVLLVSFVCVTRQFRFPVIHRFVLFCTFMLWWLPYDSVCIKRNVWIRSLKKVVSSSFRIDTTLPQSSTFWIVMYVHRVCRWKMTTIFVFFLYFECWISLFVYWPSTCSI